MSCRCNHWINIIRSWQIEMEYGIFGLRANGSWIVEFKETSELAEWFVGSADLMSKFLDLGHLMDGPECVIW